MLPLVDASRAYDPETVAVMTAAYDRVCQTLSARMNGDEELKRKLARTILRHVDRGERDPELLAEAAFREGVGR